MGHAECARLLIDSGADKEARDDVRRWALFGGGTILIYFSLHFRVLFDNIILSTASFAIQLYKSTVIYLSPCGLSLFQILFTLMVFHCIPRYLSFASCLLYFSPILFSVSFVR